MPRLALLLTTLIWGATFPATKAALEQIPPFSFLFLRFLLGVLLVGGGFLLWRLRLHREPAVLRASAIATCWLFLGYVLQTVGLHYTTASNSAFITALYVVIVPLILRRFDRRVWLGTGIATVGLWLLVKPSASGNLGDLLTLGCAVSFAAHIACLERFTREVDAPSLFAWQMIASVVLLLPTMLIEQAPAQAFAPTALLLVGLGVTGGACDRGLCRSNVGATHCARATGGIDFCIGAGLCRLALLVFPGGNIGYSGVDWKWPHIGGGGGRCLRERPSVIIARNQRGLTR